MEIRLASPEDAGELLRIYCPYVEETAISFEYDPPTPAEFADRIRHTLGRYPYLAAVEDGRILGYAYAGPFKQRRAYDHSVETSIYVAQDSRGRGVGSALYAELERLLLSQNVFLLYACIAATERTDDPCLTDESIRFHKKQGYRPAGYYHSCGYKFDRWYDMVWMEKQIGDLPAHPAPFVPFTIQEAME